MSSEAPPAEAAARPSLLSRVEAPYLVAAAAVAVAFVARLLVAASSGTAVLDSDQAVTGIAAQRIGSGEDFPVFFPGQSYMGTLEQYVQAAVLLVTPDTKLTLQIVAVILGAATAGMIFLVGARVTASPWGGALAAGLFAIGPWYLLDKGVKSHGAYAAGTLIAVVCLYLALRLRPRERAAPWVALGVGLTAGLVVWELWLGFYIVIPALLWGLAAARRDPLLLVFGAAGALVGASPFIAQRFAEGWGQAWGYEFNPPTSAATRASGLLDPVTGMFLGVAKVGAGEPYISWLLPAFVVAAALGVLGAAVWTRRRGLAALVTLREEGRSPVDVVLLGFLISPFLYVASEATWFTGEPRYLFTLYPLLALGAAAAVMALGPRVRVWAAVAALAGLGLITLVGARDALRGDPVTFTIVGGTPIRMDDLPDVADRLDDLGVDTVYADYWLAYPLEYLSGGDVIASPFTNTRFPELDGEVRADTTPAYAAPVGPAADQVRNALTAEGITFREDTVDSIVVFRDLSEPVTPTELGLHP